MPKGKKKLIIITLIIYCFALLLQQFSALFEAWAKEINIPKINIVTILVDDSIYPSIQSDLQRYATQYIQQEIPQSKALVIPLNLQSIDAYQIYKMMENIYFDGLKDVNSTLLGLILVGDIPLPVINQDGYIFPSIYPYVDFIHQKYVRDPRDEYFVPDQNPNGQAEIWHGLINYGTDATAYHKFFEKIKTYKADPSKFIGEDMWYEDFIANKEGFMEDVLPYYQNTMIFGEDISYQKYHELMLDLFKGNQDESATELIQGLNADLVALGGSEFPSTTLDGKELTEKEGISTLTTERSIKEGFLADFPQIFSPVNGETMRDNALAGGRRVETYREGNTQTGQAQLKAKTDSSIDMINLKDSINLWTDEVQGMLVNVNKLLEEAIDKKIVKENYDMDIVLPLNYHREEKKYDCFTNRGGVAVRVLTAWLFWRARKCACYTWITDYDNYYFGKNANLISTAEELSIYRGTRRNLADLNNASISTFNASANPLQSKADSTNLLYKNISASYDAFSTQIEANKGYNLLNAEKDIDVYERNKTLDDYDPKSPSGWWPHDKGDTCRQWMFRREVTTPSAVQNAILQGGVNNSNYKVEKGINGNKLFQLMQESKTVTKEPREDRYDDEHCESLQNFTDRRRGGAGLVNLDPDKVPDEYKIKDFARREARASIFDIGGSKALSVPEPNANSFKAFLGRRDLFFTPGVARNGTRGTGNRGYGAPIAQMLTVEKNNWINREASRQRSTGSGRGGYKRQKGKAQLNPTIRPTNYNSFSSLDYFNLNQPILDLRKIEKAPNAGTFKISGKLANYGKIVSEVSQNSTRTDVKIRDSLLPPQNNDILSATGGKEGIRITPAQICKDIKATYTYKTISSVVKNDSPTQEELKGVKMMKYGENSSLTQYHRSIIQSLESLQKEVEETETPIEAISTGFDAVTSGFTIIVNTALGTGSDFDTVNQTLKDVLKQLQEVQQLARTFYIALDGINALDTFNELDQIDFLEVMFLKSWNYRWERINKLDCPSQRQRIIKELIDAIIKGFDEKVATYKKIFEAFEKIKQQRPNIQTQLEEDGNKEHIDWTTANSITEMIKNFFIMEYTDEEWESRTVTIEKDAFDDKMKQQLLEGSSGTDEAGNAVQTLGVRQQFNAIFQINDKDEEIKISWINLITLDRPIDSPRYTTFQGIGKNEIKFIYPDIFKVESYTIEPKSGKCKLLTVAEIKANIIKYLNNKVNEYNGFLSAEKATAASMDLRYDKLNEINPKATPILDATVRPYNLFTYNDLLKALDNGESYASNPHAIRREGKPEDKAEARDVLEIIAELLYYQNITNPTYACKDNMLEDIKGIQETFDINNKTEYVLNEYLTEKNEYLKSPLVIPDYKKLWYEVAYVNSDGDDYVRSKELPDSIIDAQNNQFVLDNQDPPVPPTEQSDEELDLQEKCKIPVDGSVLIFDIQQMNSPRYDAFKCRLEEGLKVKVSLNFSESLGPVVDFSRFLTTDDEGNINGTDSQGLSSYMKEYFADSFKRRGDDMADYEEQRETLTNTNEKETDTTLAETEYVYNKQTKENMEKSKRLADYYNNIKTFLSNTTLNTRQTSSTLKISSTIEVGTVEFHISLTGDSCLQIDTTNLCTNERIKAVNPKNTPQTLTVSGITGSKAGVSLMTVAMCQPGTSNCVTKSHRVILKEGEPSTFTIQSESNTSIAGVLTQVKSAAFDAAKNPVDQVSDTYTMKVDVGSLFFEGGYSPAFTVKRFKNLTFYYRAPEGYVGPAKIELVSSTGLVLATKVQTVTVAHPEVKLNDKIIITSPSQQGNWNTTLKNYDESHSIDGNKIRQLNTNYLQKVEVRLKNPQNQPINVVDAKILVKSPKGYVNIWAIGEKIVTRAEKKLPQTIFDNKGIFEFEDGKITFYFYPNTTAGKDTISIEIPWMDPLIINVEIFPAQPFKLEIKTEPQTIKLEEEVSSEITVRDIRSNLVTNATSVKVTPHNLNIDDGIPPERDPTPIPMTIEGGRGTFKAQGIKSWIGYLTAKIDGVAYETKPAISRVSIEGTLFPTSGLNILYLNYFGNDRGNQRGYFSNNKNYIENLMNKSPKIITTTTQLVAPNKVKEMLRGIAPNFTIKNYGGINTTLAIKGGNIQVQAGDMSTVTTNVGKISRIETTSDEVITTTLKTNTFTNNVAYFIPNNKDYHIQEGNVYKNGVKIDDTVYATLTTYYLGQKYQIWEVRDSSTSYGNLVISFRNYTLTADDFSLPVGNYSIETTFSNGTSNKISTIGIFHNENRLQTENGYLSIQDSPIRDNNIGFRGDFKNITLFAQGERVGEATRNFGSEFVINLWDPLLKKYNKNPEVYDTDYDGGFGQEIFSDPEKSIFKTLPIDFNNDGLEDMLIVYNDGSIKLAKNYGSEPNFYNLQDLVVIGIGIEDVYIGDVDGNGYDDIIIKTKNNQLRTYLNDGGIFDVDGNLICLNTNVNEGKKSETPGNMSGIYQFFIQDMDMDGKVDIVTNDKKGQVKIFYGGNTNDYANYVSKLNYACDEEWYERQKANTLTVTQFWFNLDERTRILDNSMITRYGLEIPEFAANANDLSDLGIDISAADLAFLSNDENLKNFKSEPNALLEMAGKDNFDAGTMGEAGAEIWAKYREIQTSFFIDNKKTNIFVPISYLKTNGNKAREQDPVTVYKTYKNLSGGNLQQGNVVEVTVTIQAVKSFIGAFGDVIQWPWELLLNDKELPASLTGFESTQLILHAQDEDFNYLIDNIRLRAGQSLKYTYQLVYKDKQTQSISIEDIKGTDYNLSFSADGYPDIKTQSSNTCLRDSIGFINTVGNKHRSYTKKNIPIQDLIDEYAEKVNTIQEETEKAISNQLSGAYMQRDTNEIPGFSLSDVPRKELLNSAMININIFDDQVNKIQQDLDNIQDGLCNGFSFGGNNNCQGLPVPFNQAILAPGNYHLFWCYDIAPLSQTLGKGIPVLSFPAGILPFNIPAAQFLGIWPGFKNEGTDGFLGVPGGAIPSFVRIYIAPTLTMQIGVALCLWTYNAAKLALPSPIGDVAGNCIVFAIKPQCKQEKSQAELNNPNETFLPRTQDLTQSCTQERKGEAARQAGYASSPFMTDFGRTEFEDTVYPTSRSNFTAHPEEYSRTTGWPDNGYSNTMPETNLGGIFSIEGTSHNNGQLTIGNTRIAGGDLSKNKIKSWFQQGLRKVLIDDRLDREIRYIAAHFTKMNLHIKFPNLDDLLQEAQTLENITKAVSAGATEGTTQAINGVTDFAIDSREALKNIKNINTGTLDNAMMQYKQLSEGMRTVNDQLANPFEQLSLLFNESKLININTKNLTVKIPMIFNEDINAYDIYLKERMNINTQIAQQRIDLVTSVKDLCIEDFEKYDSPQEALAKGVIKKDCPIDIRAAIRFSADFELLLDQVNANILILNEYREFPFALYERVHAIDRYIAEISAIINNFLGYLSYRMTTNANRYASYIDAIILVMNIIKTYQILIDFSINRGNKCSTCTNDTYDQYSCKLAILCQGIQLPLIDIPNFKIPDITLDFSNLNIGMNILLPSFNFQPAKIDLPNLPNLPSPPITNLAINIDILPDLPTIPELPAPPRLPELPSFIPNINIELPILPPAPKIPEIPIEFERVLNIAEKIWKIYCIVKKGFGLVWELSVKAKIEQITQRTYEVPRIDNIINLTNIISKRPRPKGFDYEILATTNIQFNFSDIYNLLDTLTDVINNLSTNVAQTASNRMQDAVDQTSEAISDGVNNALSYTSDEVNYVEYPQAKQRLENVLAYFENKATQQISTTNALQQVQTTIQTPSDIQPNQQGINQMKEEITTLITQQQDKLSLLAQLDTTNGTTDEEKILLSYDNLLKNLEKADLLTKPSDEQQLAFSTNLFTVDKNTKKIVTNLENPYQILLDNKANTINGFLSDLENNPNVLTPDIHQFTKNTLLALQGQIAGFYQRTTPTYQTSLQTKTTTNSANSTSNKLLTAATSNGGGTSVQKLDIDPASHIEGVFARNKSNANFTNVVYSTLNAQDFSNKSYFTDINKDGTQDIVLRNATSIFIKYGLQNDKFWWGGSISKFYSKSITKLNNEETRLEFDKETILKVYDQHEEVKHFQINGQSFDTISISRRKNRETSVDGYLLKVTERIDHSPEKQDITNNTVYKKFLLILPKGTPTTGLKLEITNKIDTIENLLDKELLQVRYFDPNKEDPNIIIDKVDRKRQYARIVTVTNNKNTLEITSPRSNQIVAGRQIISDNLPPLWEASLYRPSTQETVSTGDTLEGYVGTHYNIIINREDNVALAKMETEVDGKIVKSIATHKQKDQISIDNLFFTKEGSYRYYSHAVDHNGNAASKSITLNIKIPEIAITNIEKNSDTQATITAELSQDIDEGNVTFQKNRHGYRSNLTAQNQGKSIEDYELTPKMTVITGQYYQLNGNIGLYSKDNQLIAEIDPDTGELSIKDNLKNQYTTKVSLTSRSPVIQVYNQAWQLVFNITLPTEKLISVTAPNYTVSTINDTNLWTLNGGKAVHKNGENIVLVSPTGQIYSDKNLMGSYKYNSTEKTVSYLFKESSTSTNTIEIIVKIKPFQT